MGQGNIHKTMRAILLISLVLLTTNLIVAVHAKTYEFTATISPVEVGISQLATYLVTISNTGDSTLGSASIAIPQGFTVLSPITILNPSSMWDYTLSTTTISLTATTRDAVLLNGTSLTFTFDSIAPASSGITTWTTEASTSLSGGGVKLTLQGAQPTVIVSSLFLAPTISASPGTINQGQISLLSQITPTSGGTSPYIYQWSEAYNGETFSLIVSANGPDYSFLPTTSTTPGIWSFKLNVTDSSSIPETVTSNTVNIIVNSELAPPVVNANPNALIQDQPSTLTSSPVWTGTSPYTYQWYQKAPGDYYTAVGDNSASYTFPGTTTIGTWTFIIQLTDNTGAKVNSTALDLIVSSTPVFTITVTQTANGAITPGTTSVTLGGDQVFTISPDIGYQITDVLVDGISVGAVTSYTFLAVAASHGITANFGDTSVGTYFINVVSSHGTPTLSAQVNPGASFTASVTSPEGDTSHRWICIGYSIDGGTTVSGTSYTFINVQADHTITFNWQEQYHVAVVSANGLTTGTGWYNAGTTATASVTSSTITSSNGTRQFFTGWTGDATGTGTTSNPITVDGTKTATATWKTQYQVTYATSGNILQVTAPPTEWVDQGLQPSGSFPTSTTNSAGDTRIIFMSDNRPESVIQPTTIIAIYQAQYLVTFIQNGIASDGSGTVVTILAETKTYEQLPNSIWTNAGESITFSYLATVESTETNKQYILSSTNFLSPLTINEPTTIQGNYNRRVYSSGFSLNMIAPVAILLAITPFLAVLLFLRRRKRNGDNRITPIATEGGSISPNTVQTVENGDNSTIFIISAHPGYKIADVVVDNAVHLGAIRTHKFVNVTGNHTISANFSKE